MAGRGLQVIRRDFLRIGGVAVLGFPVLAGVEHRFAGKKERTMEIKRNDSQPSGKGPVDWFTGMVRIDPLFQAQEPARAAGASVTFEPGARTAWHTHPLGQTLIVTAGGGRAQVWGGPIEEIRPGDVVWFPPGEKHWHGAAPTSAMRTLRSKKRSKARLSNGWNMSPTRSTRIKQQHKETNDE